MPKPFPSPKIANLPKFSTCVPLGVMVLALLISLRTISAAPITFSAPQTVAGDADVVTNGTLVAAYTWGTAATVNGVSFPVSTVYSGVVGSYFSVAGFTARNATAFTSTANPFNSLSTAYKNALKGSIYTSATGNLTATATLNVVPSHQYLIQFWVSDPRSGVAGSRVETITDAEGNNSQLLDFNSLDAAGGVGEYTIGTFTADSPTQQFHVVSSGTQMLPQINLIQIRDITYLNTNAFWSGASDNIWADSDNSSMDFSGVSFAAAKAMGITGVYFGDSDGYGNPVVQTNVVIGAGGASGVNVLLQNNLDQYTLSSSDAIGITGTNSLWKLGSGPAILVGTNTYSGMTTVAGGTMTINGSLSGGGPVAVGRGATLDVSAGSVLATTNLLVGATAIPTSSLSNAILNLNGCTLAVETIQAGATGAVSTINWNDGTVTNYDANTDLSIGTGVALVLNPPGTHTLGIAAGRMATVNATISGTGDLTKAGGGTVFLNAINPGTGNLLLNAGEGRVDGTLGGGVVVNGGALLSGSGTVAGSVVVAGGASVRAGDQGTGALTVGSLTLGANAGDTATLYVNRNLSPGLLSVTNQNGLVANGGAGSVVINVEGTGLLPGEYPLIAYQGSIGGSGFSAFRLGSLPSEGQGYLVSTPTSIDVVVTSSGFLRWSGALSTEWSTENLAAPKNWVLDADGVTPADFSDATGVLFEDSAVNPNADISSGDVRPLSVVFLNTNKTITVTGANAISGATSLLKQGPGQVTLANDNSYTGGTLVNQGNLQLGNGGTSGSVVGSIVDNGEVILDRSDAVVFGNPLSGAGGWAQNGPGTVTIPGANSSFSGPVVLNAGHLQVGNNLALGSGPVSINSAALSSDGATARTITNAMAMSGIVTLSDPTNNGALTFTGPVTLTGDSTLLVPSDITVVHTFTGPITGGSSSVALTKTGPSGILALSGVGSYRGGTYINEGRINAQNNNCFGPGPVTVSNGASLLVNVTSGIFTNAFFIAGPGFSETTGLLGAMRLNGSATVTGPVTLTAGARIGAYNRAGTVSGPIGESGGSYVLEIGTPNLADTGVVTLTGTNTYSGGTLISGGTLQLGDGVLNGMVPGAVVDNAWLSLLVPTNSTAAFGASVSGSGSVTVRSTGGTLYLTGTNSFGGALVVTAGRLELTNPAAVGSASTIVVTNAAGFHADLALDGTLGSVLIPSTAAVLSGGANTALINLGGSNEIDGSLTLTAGGVQVTTAAGNLTLLGNIAPGVANCTLTLGGAGTGVTEGMIWDGTQGVALGSVVKTGTGTWSLAGNNTYSGNTTVNQGTLLLDGSAGSGSQIITVNSNAIFGGMGTIYGNVAVQRGGILQGGDLPAGGTLTINGTLDLGSPTNTSDLTFSQFSIAAGGRISASVLDANGSNVVNILDSTLAVGTYDLIDYSGAIGGQGFAGFSLGQVPPGVTAHLQDTGTAIQLVVTDVQVVPLVTLTSPAAGSTYAAYATIPLTVNVNPNGTTVTSIEYLTNGSTVAIVAAAPYATNWMGALPGAYKVTARAHFGSSQIDTVNRNITVSPLVAPSVGKVQRITGGLMFTFSGPNGQPYTLLTSTNLALPLGQWQTNVAGYFTGSPVGVTNSTAASEPSLFYKVRCP